MSSNIKIENIHLHKNIEDTLGSLLERYHISSNIIHVNPDYSYLDYYIASDSHIGLVMTKDFKKFEAITHNDINKIILMKIHHSVLDYYNLDGEMETAKFFNDLFHF